MSNPSTGYNARHMKILFDGEVIAAVQTRELTFNRESVDVSNDDSDGFRVLLDEPGMKSVDVSIEGVATLDNYDNLLSKWNGTTYEDVTILHPNGTVTAAADGFLLSGLTFGGAHNEHVAFSAELQSSGVVTNTPEGSA